MTKQQFIEKYNESEYFDTQDVLMRIASNLSDIQEIEDLTLDPNHKVNLLKEYIFDYKAVLRNEEMIARYQAQDEADFQNHLSITTIDLR